MPLPEPLPPVAHAHDDEDEDYAMETDDADEDGDEDGADHAYTTSSQVTSRPPGSTGLRGRPRLSAGAKRGRKKKLYNKMDWERRENFMNVEDRRERRRLKRLQKEQDDRLRKLKKVILVNILLIPPRKLSVFVVGSFLDNTR